VGFRTLNPYRWALETCEPFCDPDICKEYANRLAHYFDCHCHTRCAYPINPAHNKCRRNWW
jgi:hypothetical protein